MNYRIHASNIHTDEGRIYGPFAPEDLTGITLTYEHLRIGDDTIATWNEAWEADANWIDQDGQTRNDGWRMMRTIWNRPAHDAQGVFQGRFGHQQPFDPCWTDLWIEPTNDPAIDRDRDWDRIEGQRPAPTTTEGAWR